MWFYSFHYTIKQREFVSTKIFEALVLSNGLLCKNDVFEVVIPIGEKFVKFGTGKQGSTNQMIIEEPEEFICFVFPTIEEAVLHKSALASGILSANRMSFQKTLALSPN